MNRTRKILLYIVFALVMLGVFLYYRFPSEMVDDALSQQIARIDPKVELDTDTINPTIPPGLKLKPLTVNYAQVPILRMDFLKVKPELLSLFSSSKRYVYHAAMGSGTLSGRAQTTDQGDREISKVVINLKSVPLKYIEIIHQWKNYKPDGDMDATINFDSLKGGGTADVDMDISPASVAFDPPLMGIESLDFTRFNTKLIVTQRMLQIRSCDAVGDQIEGKITGSIIFREPVEESRISLSLTVKPKPAFIAYHKNDLIGGMLSNANAQKRGVIFRISGTLINPRYVIR